MNEKQFKVKLARFIAEEKGGVNAYARELGVSPSMVSHMKRGSKRPTSRVLDDMGMERIETVTVRYQRVGY